MLLKLYIVVVMLGAGKAIHSDYANEAMSKRIYVEGNKYSVVLNFTTNNDTTYETDTTYILPKRATIE